MFTENDLKQIESKGISLHSIHYQLDRFRNGFPFVRLCKPATVADGIIKLTQKEAEELREYFDKYYIRYNICKFVPASGAASRMFKDLYSLLEWYHASEEDKTRIHRDKEFNPVLRLFDNMQSLPFYNELKGKMHKAGLDLPECLRKEDYHLVVEYIITEKGLNYGNLPKGLLLFHRYKEYSRTPVEEHMAEGAIYSKDLYGKVRIHFTLSPEHVNAFRDHIREAKERMESLQDVNFDISDSIQKPSTDTIAVDMNNEPFREKDGTLVFRPGGHGALLENLGELEGDIIFIKNIDNVVPDKLKEETYLYKKALAGLLMITRLKVFFYLHKLNNNTAGQELDQIIKFAKEQLFIRFDKSFEDLSADKKAEILFRKLNRPIRVCGMVKNEGEPGGGPFWLMHSTGDISLQIVESSQVDMNDPEQKSILLSATHFNPVALVCSIYDFQGNKFDLPSFVDPSTGFISVKSKDGRKLKALELPGLWNGAMADWITLFVEIPLLTFNPVKVINDLLRETHQ